MSNSAANTDYSCRKATCCGEDDPFPNFTQGLLPYRISLHGIRCVSTYTPPLPAPTTDPEFNGDCMGVTTECIKELLTTEDNCGTLWTSESYVCAVQKALETCGDPTDTQFCNDEQTCCVTCPDGTVNCYTIAAGLICASTKALANAQAYDIACQRAEEFKMCVEGCPTCCCVGDAYSFTFTIDGGLATKTIEVIDGALPPGLSLTDATVAGVPTLAGNWTFSIRVDDGRMQAVKTCTMFAIEVATASLTDYRVGTAYSFQLTASGGSGSYVWKIVSGTLPAGLSMSTTGLISGTPTAPTTSTLRFEVIDNACELADKTYFPPKVAMTGASTTTIATIKGFDPYIQLHSPPKRYRRLEWSGTSEQYAYTFAAPPRQCSGARYVWSGYSEINIYGVFTSKYRKDYFSQCPGDTTIPYITTIPDFGLTKLEGYCWPADPSSCPTCTASPYDFVADRCGNHIYDGTTFLNNPTGAGHSMTALTISNTSSQAITGFISGAINFDSPPQIIIHAAHNYSSALSVEYTDADALASATVLPGNGLVAESRPRTNQYTSRWTSVVYTLACSDLIVGQDYIVRVRFWMDTGAITYATYNFTASATTHTITGNVPTPPDGHTIEATGVTITYV